MRIAFLNKDLVKQQDRLVDMDIEFLSGPKEKHKGPIMLEATLRDKDDVEKFKLYLDKLTGDLPLAERKVYKSSTKNILLLPDEPLKDLIKEVEKKCKSIDEAIAYLRQRGFVFVTSQFIEDKGIGTIIKEHHKDYQFMIRLVKQAKDPKNDKYDPQLILGMKFLDGKKNGIKVYLYGKFENTLISDWAKKSDINFKKIKLTKFPHYMNKEERERYRMEERKYELNPELEKSKFWLRWAPAVKEANK